MKNTLEQQQKQGIPPRGSLDTLEYDGDGWWNWGTPIIAICWDNFPKRNVCPFCGNLSTWKGCAPYLAVVMQAADDNDNSLASLCRECGREHAPELLDLIEEQECNLFNNVEEVFLEGKQDEVITQVGRKEIRGVLRGETGGLPDWIVAKIREKYSARAAAVSAVCDEGAPF